MDDHELHCDCRIELLAVTEDLRREIRRHELTAKDALRAAVIHEKARAERARLREQLDTQEGSE